MKDNTNNRIQKLSCCYIENLVSMQHNSCALQRRKSDYKNEMIGFNLDDYYEIIKPMFLLEKEVKVEDVKDTLRLNVAMMKFLQHPEMHALDEIWVCPNLLRGMKINAIEIINTKLFLRCKMEIKMEIKMKIHIMIQQTTTLNIIKGQSIQALC